MLMATLVFHQLVGIPSGSVPYLLVFLVSSAAWSLFEKGWLWATRSLQVHRRLLLTPGVSRPMVTLGTMAPAVVDLGIHAVLFVLASVWFLVVDGRLYLAPGWHSLMVLAAVGLSLTLAFALGLITAALSQDKRDVRYAVGTLLRFWYLLTPVVYPATIIPEAWRWITVVNPLATSVELFTWGMLGTAPTLSGAQIALTAAELALALALGLVVTARTRGAVAPARLKPPKRVRAER
jgi:lipopolysaccharide transport system permease protein